MHGMCLHLVKRFVSPSQLHQLQYHACRSFASATITGATSSSSELRAGRLTKNKAFNENTDVVYSIVPKEKAVIVSQYLINTFHRMEPIVVALGMPIEEIGHWFHDYIRMSMFASVTDVCVQAIDEKARKRIATLASIVIDPALRVPAHITSFIDPTKQIISKVKYEFINKLEEGIDVAHFRKASEDEASFKIFKLMFLGMDPNYGGKGIGHKMMALSESIAKTVINCRFGYCVATSEFSYKIVRSLGYEVVKEIKYADYVDSKGEKIFADKVERMQPHTVCRAMVKRLKNHYE